MLNPKVLHVILTERIFSTTAVQITFTPFRLRGNRKKRRYDVSRCVFQPPSSSGNRRTSTIKIIAHIHCTNTHYARSPSSPLLESRGMGSLSLFTSSAEHACVCPLSSSVWLRQSPRQISIDLQVDAPNTTSTSTSSSDGHGDFLRVLRSQTLVPSHGGRSLQYNSRFRFSYSWFEMTPTNRNATPQAQILPLG